MARREIMVDDFDGQEGTDINPVLPWQIGIGARNDFKVWMLDLRQENFDELRLALEPWLVNATPQVDVSRAVRGPGRPKAPRTTSTGDSKPYTPAEVRAWAAEEGLEVNGRGRISAEVTEKFEYAKGYDKKE